MVTSKSVLGAALAETIQADLAQPLPRAQRTDRPMPGVTSIMALAGRDEELSKLDERLAQATQTIARLEGELASARDGGSTAEEVARLSAELDRARTALPLQRLNPADVHLSRFSNRHPDSYRDAEYLALRDEIRAAGGNTQPIGVRPHPSGEQGKYELGFGSRRHRACSELGLPVLAMVQEMDDLQLFGHMERENRQRKDLRPYEQAVLYQQAIDAKIYPSIRKMGEALELDHSGLSRLLALARLPTEVISAFESPLDIQFDWGSTLTEAVKRNERAVIAKAREIAQAGGNRRARVVHDALVEAGIGRDAAQGRQKPLELRGAGKEVATVAFSGSAATIKVRSLAPERRQALEKAIREFLG